MPRMGQKATMDPEQAAKARHRKKKRRMGLCGYEGCASNTGTYQPAGNPRDPYVPFVYVAGPYYCPKHAAKHAANQRRARAAQ